MNKEFSFLTQTKHQGVYRTFVMRLDKLYRRNRQVSFLTKQRYYEACKRFRAYLADTYRLQKLENISVKHLVSYVLYLQERRCVPYEPQNLSVKTAYYPRAKAGCEVIALVKI